MYKVKSHIYAIFLKTVPPTVDETSSLPTAAIVFIAIGAYVVIFTIGVLIRQCLLVAYNVIFNIYYAHTHNFPLAAEKR